MGVKTVFFSYFNGLIMLNGNPFNPIETHFFAQSQASGTALF